MDRRIIWLAGVVALAVTLGIVVGSRLASTTSMMLVLAVCVGITVGLAVGGAVSLIALRQRVVPRNELQALLETYYQEAPPKPVSTSKRSTVVEAPEAPTGGGKDRSFTAVGWTDPPEGFDEG